ncbi:MAG: hypothetical protein KDM63_00900 [Verrucomicrobiae bacterium]|nr:hypothetical protein [Verrucomicrobiae bacterium]
MKTTPNSRRKSHGFIANAFVLSIAMVLVYGLAFAFRQHIRSLDNQSKTQIKIDYAQKEDAVLRALLQIVPNKAIGAMKEGSNLAPQDYSWETIFNEAAGMANAETAIDANMMGSVGAGLTNVVSGNTGDGSLGAVSSLVSPVVGSGALVNPGDTRETSLLLSSSFGGKLPAPLTGTGTVYSRDRDYPIISDLKVHSSSWTNGIHLSADSYPLYNLIDYPNIRFGYARPGDLFVGKRNWWAFSLTFGSGAGAANVAAVRKNYLLSIYEVPSQLPISSAGFMRIGQHEDGTAWTQANLRGGVFANRLQTDGTVSLIEGALSARSSLGLSNNTSVDGETLSNNFDAMGVREAREAFGVGGGTAAGGGTTNGGTDFSKFHAASLAGNVGKVAFIPLNTGTSFLYKQNDGSISSRLSPTGWHAYTNGANKAAMWLEVRRMYGSNDQTPRNIRFYYINTSGSRVYRNYNRGSSWPTINQSGGDSIPFQTDVLDVGRRVLTVDLEKLRNFLPTLGNAADLTVNNSILVYPEPTAHSTVREPNIPSTSSDLALAINGGGDLSQFTAGFSVVTNLRTYIVDSLNTVPITPPANSGLDPTVPFYPPLSLFAPEKRFGTSMLYNNPIEFNGQVSSLKLSETEAFRPLDLVNGGDETVHPSQIEANLTRLQSPAQLPPIHLMNWLVTIEEIHDGEAQ